MNGTFSMDTAQVSQIGAKIQELSREYANDMTQLRSTIEDLGSSWKSEVYNKFVSVYEKNAETIDQMSKAFASFGDMLTSTSNEVNRITQDLSDDIR